MNYDVEPETTLHTGEVPHYTEKAFDVPMKDSVFFSSVVLNYAMDSLPVMYSSIISTPVCDDGLCKTLELKMNWNLIGNYVWYDTVAGAPLTKFDHIPFEEPDYEKLQEILADKNSVLERKTLDELFDKDSVRKSNTVDAITGATAKEVKNAIVEGALYSTYKLWHIAHGNITSKIRDYTKTIFTPDLGKRLLVSEDYQEQLFALKLFKDEDFYTYFDPVLGLLVTSNPLVEMYILKKLPIVILEDSVYQIALAGIFSDMDINGKTMLLTRMKKIDTVNATSLMLLSTEINKMDVRQLKAYLELLELNQNLIDKRIMSNLRKALASTDAKGFYIIKFLEQTK